MSAQSPAFSHPPRRRLLPSPIDSPRFYFYRAAEEGEPVIPRGGGAAAAALVVGREAGGGSGHYWWGGGGGKQETELCPLSSSSGDHEDESETGRQRGRMGVWIGS